MQSQGIPVQYLTTPDVHPAVCRRHMPHSQQPGRLSGNARQKWLDWSLLKPKVPKCAAMSINGQTGRTANPRLHISHEKMPFLGNNSTSFLGLPINATLSMDSIKEQIQSKLDRFLTVTDRAPLSRQQKLKMYCMAICPRRTWLLSLADLPLTWVERTLEPPVTRFLKKWCSLSRSADPARIFLSKTNGGRDIPSITTCFKKAQVSRYSQLMSSTDSTCRFLAERKHTRDTGTHKKLKPTEEVIATMKEYPNATRKKLASETRKRIAENYEKALVNHASSLVKESHLSLSRRREMSCGVTQHRHSQNTTLPSPWLQQWTPSRTMPTYADGRS